METNFGFPHSAMIKDEESKETHHIIEDLNNIYVAGVLKETNESRKKFFREKVRIYQKNELQ